MSRGDESERGASGADGPQRDGRPAGRRRQLVVGAVSLALAGGVVALLVAGLVARGTSTALDDAIVAGRPRPAPAFSLPILVNGRAIGRRDGQQLSLSDLRGRPVVLNFWASWCTPCKSEAPRLEAAWVRHRGQGVVMLGVDVQDLSDDARAFVRRYRQTYPSVRDRHDATFTAYGLTGVPETFFVDGGGRVRAHVIGEISTRQLDEGIALVTTTRGK
ncbi:MAG: redoxin domain-containing protein [Actinomycetota bacterium]